MSEPAGVWLPKPLVGEWVDAHTVVRPSAVSDDRFSELLAEVLEDQGEQLAALAGLETARGW